MRRPEAGISESRNTHVFSYAYNYENAMLTSGFLSHMKVMTDIGAVIREKLRERGKSVVWLARQLSCSRTNVYKIFDKHSVDTQELLRISVILNYDFFQHYSEEYKKRNESYV